MSASPAQRTLPNTSALLKQSLRQDYPLATHGKGVFIFDEHGRDVLDGSSGAMTVSMGHGNAELAATIGEQATTLAFVYRTQFTNEPAEVLASKLASLAPGDLNTAFFVNSGSEASEFAIRSAVHHWQELGKPEKVKVLGRHTSYHGMTMGALSMSGHPLRRPDYGSLLHAFPVAPPAYAYRFAQPGETEEAYAMRAAAEFEREVVAADPDTVAAIIVEPIVGAAGGVLVPPAGYLAHLRDMCDRLDVLMIVDEVITGIGRTGAWFACETEGIVPDILSLGKGLSGGYAPYAGVLLRDHLVEAIDQGSGVSAFGHTFSCNPLGAAASLKVLEIMERDNLLENVSRRGAELEAGLRELATKYPQIADVRGRGLMWGFEFVVEQATRTAPHPSHQASNTLVNVCFEEGLIVYPAGIAPLNNAVIISPPIIITRNEVQELLRRLDRALARMSDDMQGWGPAD